jgi:hypothetical protein
MVFNIDCYQFTHRVSFLPLNRLPDLRFNGLNIPINPPGHLYSGCQKNVPVFKRFFLQPLMPPFLISERYYGKRYKIEYNICLEIAK